MKRFNKLLLVLTILGFTFMPYVFVEADTTDIVYYYDDLNRLTYVYYGSGKVVEYTYDEVGNRTLKRSLIDIVPPVTSASLEAGSYNTSKQVTLSCNDGTGIGCSTIYYALGAILQNTQWNIYNGNPISINADTTLNFYAVDFAGNQETFKSQSYKIDTTPPITSANPPGGTYNNVQSVTLTSNEPGATIYWSTSTEPFNLYNGAISIASNTELKYYAVDVAGNIESTKSQSYRFCPDGGSYNASISRCEALVSNTYQCPYNNITYNTINECNSTCTQSAACQQAGNITLTGTIQNACMPINTTANSFGNITISGANFSGSVDGSGGNCTDCSVVRLFGNQNTITSTPATNTVFLNGATVSGQVISCRNSGTIGCALTGTANRISSSCSGTINFTPSMACPIEGGSACNTSNSCTKTYACNVINNCPSGYVFDGSACIANTYPLLVTRNGKGSVTSQPTGINCGADCSEYFNSGSLITLTAIPDTGSIFSGWTGCESTNGNNCTITMSEIKNVSANFCNKHWCQSSIAISEVQMHLSGKLKIYDRDAQVGDEIAVFDSNGLMIGSYYIESAGQYGDLVIFGDDTTTPSDEGALSGEKLVIKVWDGITQREYSSPDVIMVKSPNSSSYRGPLTFSTAFPIVMDVEVQLGVKIMLNSGWNLIGWNTLHGYFEGIGPQPNEYVSGGVITQMQSLKMIEIFSMMGLSSPDYLTGPEGKIFVPGSPFNTLKKFLPGKAYNINVTTGKQITIPGKPIDESGQIQLVTGWNQIGYWGTNGLSPEIGFYYINGAYDVIQDGAGNVYVPNSSPNPLSILEKDKGYWIHAITPVMLKYQSQCP